ncbi:hypothetical protein SLA2020_316220 [Shorea laevis]
MHYQTKLKPVLNTTGHVQDLPTNGIRVQAGPLPLKVDRSNLQFWEIITDSSASYGLAKFLEQLFTDQEMPWFNFRTFPLESYKIIADTLADYHITYSYLKDFVGI